MTSIALIYSREDPAGCAIAEAVRKRCGIAEDGIFHHAGIRYELAGVPGRLIHSSAVDRSISADRVVFLSRHASSHPVRILTVHVTGNFADAVFGGKPWELPPADPPLMHAILRQLSRRAPQGYQVAYEVTHHGPTDLIHPSLFVEIGSTEAEWEDPAAAAAVSDAVLASVPGDVIPMIGFGGTHYARRQTDIALKSRGAFGHIAHSREAGRITREEVALMRERSMAVGAYIDRKSISTPDVRRIEDICRDEGLLILTEGDLEGIGDLSLATYREMIALGNRMGGSPLRVHPCRLAGDGELAVVSVPDDLVQEARIADAKAFGSGIRQIPVASLSLPGTPVLSQFITFREWEKEILHALISLCITIICEKEETAIEGDFLIIHRKRFDPQKARELGVPAGPDYGLLMRGEPVRIGERLITPAMVTVPSEKRICIPGLETWQ